MDTLNEDLLNAAKNSDFTAVDKCIKNGAIVNCRDKVGGTPLHWVANRGQTNIADLLISKGASTNIKSLKGKTPLHLAAKRGYKDTAVLLISNGADINSRDKFGGTPLHWAASRGQRDTAHLLISRGANVNIKRINDVTPLHLAASKDHTDTADLLISKGADIDTKSISGYTALDMAEGKTKMVLQSINESQVTGAAKYCDILGESPSNVHSLLQARSPVSHDIPPADRVQRPEQDNEMSGIKDATTFKSLLYGGTYESYGNCIYLAGACNVGKSTLASLLIGDKIPLKWKSTNGLRIYFGRNGIDVKNRKMVPLKKGKGNFVLSNVLRGHPDIKQDVTEKGVDFSDLTLNDGDVKHPSEFGNRLYLLLITLSKAFYVYLKTNFVQHVVQIGQPITC